MIAYSAASIVQAEITNDTIQTTLDGLRDNLVLAGWSLTNSSGGYTLRSAKTPQGLQCQIRAQASGAVVSIVFNTISAVLSPLPMYLTVQVSRKLKIIANPYQFFTFLAEGPAVAGTSVMGGVPYIHPHHRALAVSNIIQGNPVQIVTTDPHLMVDGQSGYLTDVEGTGLSALNASWTVEVVNSTTVRLVGSNVVGGTWTSNTGLFAPPGKISRLIWSMADSNGSGSERASFRSSIYPNVNRNVYVSVALNQMNWNLNSNNAAGRPGIITPPYGVRWFNNQYINCEPYLVFGPASSATDPVVVAQLWDAVAINFGFVGELTTIFDGHTWLNYTGVNPSFEQNGALCLAVN